MYTRLMIGAHREISLKESVLLKNNVWIGWNQVVFIINNLSLNTHSHFSILLIFFRFLSCSFITLLFFVVSVIQYLHPFTQCIFFILQYSLACFSLLINIFIFHYTYFFITIPVFFSLLHSLLNTHILSFYIFSLFVTLRKANPLQKTDRNHDPQFSSASHHSILSLSSLFFLTLFRTI